MSMLRDSSVQSKDREAPRGGDTTFYAVGPFSGDRTANPHPTGSQAPVIADSKSILDVDSEGLSGMKSLSTVFHLTQCFFSLCGLATILLWVWRVRNDPADQVAARLVTVLFVYFCLFFVTYGARELRPSESTSSIDLLSAMTGAWLPVGCGFAVLSPEKGPIA